MARSRGNRSVVIRGVDTVKAQLRRYGRAANKAFAGGLFIQGEKIMAVSKTEVPVDLGPLRASGHVDLPVERAGGVDVVLGFGGPAGVGNQGETNRERIGYALIQHERLDYRHTVGKAKYLSDPAEAQAPRMAPEIAKHIEREMERA